MIKNISKKFIIILPILLLSCGFKPISHKNGNEIYFKDINIIGNQKIAYNLKNSILLSSNKNSNNEYEANIKLNQQKKDKIKDKSGKITRYELIVSSDFEMIRINDNKKFKKVFTRSSDYDVAKIHSDTINNEQKAMKNIIQQISNDINNYIMFTMR